MDMNVHYCLWLRLLTVVVFCAVIYAIISHTAINNVKQTAQFLQVRLHPIA